jgi:hypothetical protein
MRAALITTMYQLTVVEAGAVQVQRALRVLHLKLEMVARVHQIALVVQRSPMLVAVALVLITAQQLDQVVRVEVETVQTQQLELQVQLIRAAVVVEVLTRQTQRVVQVARVLLLFPTLAHNEAQAARLHLAVDTPFTLLLRLAHLPHKENHGTFCKSIRRKSYASHCG